MCSLAPAAGQACSCPAWAGPHPLAPPPGGGGGTAQGGGGAPAQRTAALKQSASLSGAFARVARSSSIPAPAQQSQPHRAPPGALGEWGARKVEGGPSALLARRGAAPIVRLPQAPGAPAEPQRRPPPFPAAADPAPLRAPRSLARCAGVPRQLGGCRGGRPGGYPDHAALQLPPNPAPLALPPPPTPDSALSSPLLQMARAPLLLALVAALALGASGEQRRPGRGGRAAGALRIRRRRRRLGSRPPLRRASRCSGAARGAGEHRRPSLHHRPDGLLQPVGGLRRGE